MENELPTLWSADLRDGLTMLGIEYSDFSDTQLPSIYSLYNMISYPALLCVENPSCYAGSKRLHV